MLFRSSSRATKPPSPVFDDSFRAGTPYGESVRSSSDSTESEDPSGRAAHISHGQRPFTSPEKENFQARSPFGFVRPQLQTSKSPVAFTITAPSHLHQESPVMSTANRTSSPETLLSPVERNASTKSLNNGYHGRSRHGSVKSFSFAASPEDQLQSRSPRSPSKHLSHAQNVDNGFQMSTPSGLGCKRSTTANYNNTEQPGLSRGLNEKSSFQSSQPKSFRKPSHSSLNEKANPFATPDDSKPPSLRGYSPVSELSVPRFFHSRRIRKDAIERTWPKEKDPREKWATIIPLIGILVGCAVAGFLVWDGLRGVTNHKYCPVYVTDFSNGLDDHVWQKEAQVGGYGNGQFEETTVTDENVFVQDGVLHIKPTLQDRSLVENDNTIDLRKDGICTTDVLAECITSTNTTNGTIVNPVKSGRINTRKGASIKFGRVEVTAKLPVGDWLWPAIWMLPVNATYGKWPLSGEIDIVESRGNDHTYAQGGNNIVSSALHWGPDPSNDAWWRTNVKRQSLRKSFAENFHTFGLEWSERYLFTYIDNRLMQVLYVNFDPKQNLWQRGDFPLATQNGTIYTDPWSQTGRPSTPFDQDFYLIINVAVGGSNGWFQDGQSQKPWVDGSPTARRDFWNAQGEWLKTWEGGADMQIKSVKMWQQAGYNGCSA